MNLSIIPDSIKYSVTILHRSGKLRVQFDTFEASSLASGSDISVARLPSGAKVYDVAIHHDALGSGVTLAVGDSAEITTPSGKKYYEILEIKVIDTAIL